MEFFNNKVKDISIVQLFMLVFNLIKPIDRRQESMYTFCNLKEIPDETFYDDQNEHDDDAHGHDDAQLYTRSLMAI